MSKAPQMPQGPNDMHPEDKRNMIIFVIVMFAVWFAYDSYILKPRMQAMKAAQEARLNDPDAINLSSGQAVSEVKASNEVVARSEAVAENARLPFENDVISGSISLKGARLDDLWLQEHYETLEKKKHVVLLSPQGTQYARFVEAGWLSADQDIRVPNKDTVWRVRGDDVGTKLTAGKPITLFWENGQGVLFERIISLDEHYMFTVKQQVTNNSGQALKLYPYSAIKQRGLPQDHARRMVVHEGGIAYTNDDFHEYKYKKLAKQKLQQFDSDHGWIGVTERYWLVSLIPPQGVPSTYRFISKADENITGPRKNLYQFDVRGEAVEIPRGEIAENVTRSFVGAKEVTLLAEYEKQQHIKHFDLSVDFGLWYVLTKPFYHLVVFLGDLVGNFGIAIILLTIIVRTAVFPLTNASYRSFARLKQVSPQIAKLREEHSEDKQKLQEELVSLYEKEKVNPLGGCLPIIIQIPIFFALFKVLNLAIEMRHVPFYGWIKDLSERDPTSVFNLFGLLPYDVPEAMLIGGWPCIMLFFMVVQRKLNPPPQDKTQAYMMAFMPFFITYILSKYAAGLVIYWTFSNALSVLQQYIIMRRMGVEVHLFKSSKEDKDMEKAVKEGPSVHPELGVIEDELEEVFDGKGGKEEESKDISPPKPKKKKKK